MRVREEGRRRCRLRHLIFFFARSTLDLAAMRERGAVIHVCVRSAQALPLVQLKDPPLKHQLLPKDLVLSLLALLVQKRAVSSNERHELLPKQQVLSFLAFLEQKVQILTPKGRGCSG